MTVTSSPGAIPAVSFDLPIGTDDSRLGVLYGVGKYWCWSGAYGADSPRLRLLEWTDAGIVDFTTTGYSMHVVRAGRRQLVHGLFDYWLVSDADHVWLQVPRGDRRYCVLIAGGQSNVNRQHQVAWHCQTCGSLLHTEVLRHDGTPAQFLKAQSAAVVAFNGELTRRTCPTCASVHPVARALDAVPGDVLVAEAPAVRAVARPEEVGVSFGAPAVQLDELVDGTPRVVRVAGRDLCIVRTAASVFALDNSCPHRGGPLGEGEVIGTAVACPWHRFRFDLETGVSLTNPRLRVATYRAEVVDNAVIIHNS